MRQSPKGANRGKVRGERRGRGTSKERAELYAEGFIWKSNIFTAKGTPIPRRELFRRRRCLEGSCEKSETRAGYLAVLFMTRLS